MTSEPVASVHKKTNLRQIDEYEIEKEEEKEEEKDEISVKLSSSRNLLLEEENLSFDNFNTELAGEQIELNTFHGTL